MTNVDVPQMLRHCEKLIAANEHAYVDPDALTMARFIIERHRELERVLYVHAAALTSIADQRRMLDDTTRALGEALDLFDAAWCTEPLHAPKEAAFLRARELRKLVPS